MGSALEDAMPDEAMKVEVYFQMSHDIDGKKRPLESWIKRNGKDIKVKAVKQPDDSFKDYVEKDGIWVPDEDDDPGQMIIRGIGSGEIVDMDGDVMHKSALESMCNIEEGLNTWIEHNISQDWLLGSLTKSPELVYREAGQNGNPNAIIKADKPFAAVAIETDVEPESKRGVTQYRYIKKGRKFGFSVGCFYTKYEPRKDPATGRYKGVDVYEVAVAEWSSVPLPSQQQSWAEATHKAMVRKGVLPPREDEDELIYRLRSKDFDQFGPIIGPRMRKLADHYAKAGLFLGYYK